MWSDENLHNTPWYVLCSKNKPLSSPRPPPRWKHTRGSLYTDECWHGIDCTWTRNENRNTQRSPRCDDANCSLQPPPPIAWLSHQRYQLGGLLLNIVALNEVAFFYYYYYFLSCQENYTKERRLSILSIIYISRTGREVKLFSIWDNINTRDIFVCESYMVLCLVLKLHLICQRFKDD